MKKMKKPITITNVDIKLIKQMKVHCAREDIQINKFVTDAITEKLKRGTSL